jgi:hypothetical protein
MSGAPTGKRRLSGTWAMAGRTRAMAGRIGAMAGRIGAMALWGTLGTIVSAGTVAVPAMVAAGVSVSWGPEERLTRNTTVSETGLNHGALTLTSEGRLIAAWAEQDGPDHNFRIHSREREEGGSWGPTAVAVDFSPEYAGIGLGAKFPAMVILPGDTLLLVWHDYRVDGINNLELF